MPPPVSPVTSVVEKHSMTLKGHRTSVSLEKEFWTELSEIAKSDGTTVVKIVEEIDAKRTGNLSSCLRLFVLKRIKDR